MIVDRSLGRLVEDELYGAVVRAVDLRMDGGTLQAGSEALGGDEVVDTPARVTLTGLEAVRPPRVDVRLVGVEVAEGIDEACVEELL